MGDVGRPEREIESEPLYDPVEHPEGPPVRQPVPAGPPEDPAYD
jgi:hypothetical protein